MFYYRVLMWQSEDTWRHVDVCPRDTCTRVHDVCACHACAGFINGLEHS